jgi:preprotein translocase subunit SecE
VARDRQRAKARRAKRQPGAGGPAAGSASRRARDIGLDQAEADDAGLGNTSPPEPTKHAFPDVEEARLAEAGPVGFDDEEEVEKAPDEVEGDLVPAGREEDPAVTQERREHAAERGTRRRSRNRVITFLGHCVDELRRVQWPDRRHVGQGTAVVLGFVVLAGGYLGLLDAIWKPLIEAIL